MGDSGSGFFCKINGKWTLSGVVSHGADNCDPDIPTVYTNVASFLPWIARHTGIRRTDIGNGWFVYVLYIHICAKGVCSPLKSRQRAWASDNRIAATKDSALSHHVGISRGCGILGRCKLQ